MRITVDATPLLGRRSGIGTYVAHLVDALAAGWPEDELAATAFTWRGAEALEPTLPRGVVARHRRAPARLLRELWARTTVPSAELLAGASDVFHATNFVLPPLRSARGVLTVHDLAYLRFPTTVSTASLAYRHLVPAGLQRAQAVLTPSRAVADQLCDAYRVDPARVHVTPLGVDASWFAVPPPSPADRRRWGVPERYVLAVGTLEPRKNLAALIGAYARLGARPDLPPLVLAGGEGWGDRLDLQGVPPGRVVLTGHLPQPDLQGLVAGAALLAFPSVDEGFGLPPLEAFACGVPVLASDLPVTREVLGDHASFCDAMDVEALADALLAALERPVGSVASRREHASTFTWARCAETTHAAYEQALGV